MAEKQWISFNKIGEFIRRVRKAKGLTQKELADRMSISKAAVSYTERMEGNFSFTTANDILIELAGVRVELPQMKLPIVKAMPEQVGAFKERQRARTAGKRPRELPPVPTDDIRMKTQEELKEARGDDGSVELEERS